MSCKLNIKTQTKKDYQHVIYYVRYPDENRIGNYTFTTGRRTSKQIADHSGRYKSSHLFKYSVEKGRSHLVSMVLKI